MLASETLPHALQHFAVQRDPLLRARRIDWLFLHTMPRQSHDILRGLFAHSALPPARGSPLSPPVVRHILLNAAVFHRNDISQLLDKNNYTLVIDSTQFLLWRGG